MHLAGVTLAWLPATAFALTVRALRPAGPTLAPRRLSVLRATLVVAGYAIGSVEVLSRLGALTRTGVVLTWLVALAAAAVAVWRRREAPATPLVVSGVPKAARTAGRTRRTAQALRARWAALDRLERVLIGALGGLIAGELVLSLATPPNTFDSQTYHLPRIEHWVQQGSVEFFATRIHRQVTYPVGTEYLLIHLRLLTGDDRLYALVQFGAALICLLAVTRLTAQLGGGRRAQLFAAFLIGSTPLFVLESSSTQTDLVMAACVAALATLVLDGVGPNRTGPRIGNALLFAAGAGLVAVTKPNGALIAALLLCWWGYTWTARRPWAVLGTGVLVLAGMALLAGPQLLRAQAEFGNPLGPDYLRNSISLQRHDPGAILVNALRQAHTVFDTPVAPLRHATADGIEAFSRSIDINPNDPAITFDDTTFPRVAWYPSEDLAAYPAQALLVVVATLGLLIRPGRRFATMRRTYAGLLVTGAVLHAATVKWQPWGNRLLLYLVVLAAPLAGLWLAGRLSRVAFTGSSHSGPSHSGPSRSGPSRSGRRFVAVAIAVVVAAGATAGWAAMLYGWPRRLVGSNSTLVQNDWENRFQMRPQWAADYRAVGTAVRASGARRIGLVQSNNTWEYPWWLLFPGRELVAMQSQFALQRPADVGAVDAVVCATPPAGCSPYLPPGWTLHTDGTLSYAVRP